MSPLGQILLALLYLWTNTHINKCVHTHSTEGDALSCLLDLEPQQDSIKEKYFTSIEFYLLLFIHIANQVVALHLKYICKIHMKCAGIMIKFPDKTQ